MKRTSVLLAALIVISAALLSGCGVAGRPDAATVGSDRISRADFDDDLNALLDNEKFVSWLEASDPSLDIKPVSAGINPAISTQWLNLLVNQAIIDQEFEARGLEITEQDRQAAKPKTEQIFGGAENFAAFPRWFRDENLRRQERTEALTADVPPNPPAAEAELRAYFDSTMQSTCSSNQLVKHILVPTEAEAAEIKALLDAGGDFDTLAQERSIDQGSAARGGLLWCTASQELTNADPDFQAGVLVTPLGGIAGPVRSASGYHIIGLVPWSFENARPLVEQQLEGQRESPLAAVINARLQRADIWIDPRYGTLDRTGQYVVIQQPKVPEPKVRPATDELSPNP